MKNYPLVFSIFRYVHTCISLCIWMHKYLKESGESMGSHQLESQETMSQLMWRLRNELIWQKQYTLLTPEPPLLPLPTSFIVCYFICYKWHSITCTSIPNELRLSLNACSILCFGLVCFCEQGLVQSRWALSLRFSCISPENCDHKHEPPRNHTRSCQISPSRSCYFLPLTWFSDNACGFFNLQKYFCRSQKVSNC